MYRQVNDFLQEWKQEVAQTQAVLNAVTDEKLGQAIEEGHNTLGWLGWHLTTAPLFFTGEAGLKLDVELAETQPSSAEVISASYRKISEAVAQAVENQEDDKSIVELVDSFGTKMPKGAILRLLISHQTHHRGQMTVLLRQAGLTVPGVYGPTKEQS
ncbi:DinB family protein [Bacillus sp. JCM 19041]|uniref:DinB family protein n=1 Tax=Bacillus sp. JCM 19041 TaxID=1460637 RepID=UPI0006D1ED18